MDADTRHQLKQNELAEALGKIWDLSDRRSLAWLGVIVVIALAYGGYKFWGWRQQARLVTAEQALSTVDPMNPALGNAPLDRLRQLITENSDPGLVARSRLLLAQGLEARGMGPDGAANLEQAENAYREILAMPGAPAVVRAPATYRLGLLYETKRDFARARETFTSLSEDTGFAGSPFRDLARSRLEGLDELTERVEFAPGVRPLSTAEPTADLEAAPVVAPTEPEADTPPVAAEPPEQAPPDEPNEPKQP